MKRKIALLSLMLSLLIAMPVYGQRTETFMGTGVEAVDGTTFIMETQRGEKIKVRLYAVETFDLEHALGAEAKRQLDYHVKNQELRIDVLNRDDAGTLVAVAEIMRDKVDLAYLMLVNGSARLFKDNCISEEICLVYKLSEDHAKLNRLGIWR